MRISAGARRTAGDSALRLHPRPSPGPAPGDSFPTVVEDHWRRCLNSVGIARLLTHEGRPQALVDTACCAALEAGCRAASETMGRRFEGGLWLAFSALGVPDAMTAALRRAGSAPERLEATEQLLEWIACCLRRVAPGRAWRC